LPKYREKELKNSFEKTSKLIVGEYFEKMKQLYDRLISLKNKSLLMDQCEEYSGLYFDLKTTFPKVNNGRRGIFGIEFDMKKMGVVYLCTSWHTSFYINKRSRKNNMQKYQKIEMQ